MNKEIQSLLDNFPFLTLIRGQSTEYVGIVQNVSKTMISMYIFDEIKSTELKALFLSIGCEWWTETNRTIPINIVIGARFAPFSSCMRVLSAKEYEVIYGPVVSLDAIIQKRGKRKNIKLVRKTR